MFDTIRTTSNDVAWGAHSGYATSKPSDLPSELLVSMLDEMDYGVLLVDAQLHIRHANHLARYELNAGQVLRKVDGQLYTAQAHHQAELVQAAWRAEMGHRSMIEVGSDHTKFSLAVVPLKHDAQNAILVVCGKRQNGESLSMQFFANATKLSRGEVTVLQGLCEGLKAEDIASHNGVCVSTVRSQIISIRQKTGTHNIRDLVKRVAALPPMVPALRMGSLQ